MRAAARALIIDEKGILAMGASGDFEAELRVAAGTLVAAASADEGGAAAAAPPATKAKKKTGKKKSRAGGEAARERARAQEHAAAAAEAQRQWSDEERERARAQEHAAAAAEEQRQRSDKERERARAREHAAAAEELADAQLVLSFAARWNGDVRGALRHVNAADKLRPHHERQLAFRASFHASAGDFANALRDLRAARELAPEPERARRAYGGSIGKVDLAMAWRVRTSPLQPRGVTVVSRSGRASASSAASARRSTR